MSLRALVTGGAGFIGSHLVDALVARGDDVLVFDDLSAGRQENVAASARFVEGDVRDERAVRMLFDVFRPEVCFHLAARVDVRESVAYPLGDAAVNILGTISVLEEARRHGTRIVLASTGGAIYGECDGPASEDATAAPLAPYGASKLAAEEYLALYDRLYGGPHVALRYGNVYGPRQDPKGEAGVVAIFLGKLLASEQPSIFGDGEQTRDYIFVEDIVRATLAAVGHVGRFNVGTGIATSVLALYELCRRNLFGAAAAGAPNYLPSRPGEIQSSELDPRRAASELGWHPNVPLSLGIARTLAALA